MQKVLGIGSSSSLGSFGGGVVSICIPGLLNNSCSMNFFLTMMNMNQYLLQNHLIQTKITIWYMRF